jgi:hypothetical protein
MALDVESVVGCGMKREKSLRGSHALEPRNGFVGGDTMKKCGIVRPHKLSGMLKTHPDVSSKPGEHWVVGQFD